MNKLGFNDLKKIKNKNKQVVERSTVSILLVYALTIGLMFGMVAGGQEC